MDKRNWKKILLQWIGECGFSERNYFNIEQSDIDDFFQNFRNQHEKISADTQMNLTAFLKEFYPEFEIHLDDNNCVSSAEYIYIYSLLLHFCCVKYPETMFHEICQKLPEVSQQNVAIFFRELIDVQTLNKESLRHAISKIGSSTAIHISPPSNSNDSFTASSDSMSSTPIKRHLMLPRTTIITPKSHLLEERTRELFNLRAQLDTERYEKGLLELQIKQNEDQISQLNQDHKALLQQIQSLKSDITLNTNFNESQSSTENDDSDIQQLKKRLIKEVNQREEEITQLNDTIRKIQDEKVLVEQKLKFAEKQIDQCMARMEEIEMKNSCLSEELEKKENIIKYLEEHQEELEKYVAEMRTAAAVASSNTIKDRPEFNTTSDLLDSSYAQSADASRANSESPENLGVSVIDKQLRDKEFECRQLREDLLVLQSNNKILTEHLKRLIKIESEEFQINLKEYDSDDNEQDPMDNNINSLDHLNDPITQFNKFAYCLEKINIMHKFEKTKMEKTQLQVALLKEENEALTAKLTHLMDNVHNLKDCLNVTELKNDELIEEKINLEKSLHRLEDELEHMKEEYLKSTKQLEINDKEKGQIQQQLDELTERHVEIVKNYEKLQEINKKEEDAMKDQLAEMKDELMKKEKVMETYEATEKNMKAQYEQLLIQNEKLMDLNRETNIHLVAMREDLQQKEHEMLTLGSQLNELHAKNADLKQNINALMETCRLEKAKFDEYKNQQQEEETILKLKKELSQQKSLWEMKEKEMAQLKSQMDEFQSKLNQLLQIICQNLNITIKSDHPLDNFKIIEVNIKNLLKENTANVIALKRLKELEMNDLENVKHIDDLKRELNEKNTQLKQQNNTYEEVLILRAQILQYENSVRDLKEKQLQIIEQTKNEMLQENNDTKKKLEEYEMKFNDLTNILQMEKILYTDKERDLLLVVTENDELKKKLDELKMELQSSQESYIDILNDKQRQLIILDEQITNLLKENNFVRAEMEKYGMETVQQSKRLLETEDLLNNLKKQQNSIREIELQHQQIQLKLEEELKNKEILLEELENEKMKVLTKHNEIEIYKNQFDKQKEQLNDLNEKCMKLSNENECIEKEIAELKMRLQNEQEEKSLLLKSLEQSTDQLKAITMERDQQCKILECEKLKCQEFAEKADKLFNELAHYDKQLQLNAEDKSSNQNNFQEKLFKIMEKNAQQTEVLSIYEKVLIQMTTVIENHINSNMEELLTNHNNNNNNNNNHNNNKSNHHHNDQQYDNDSDIKNASNINDNSDDNAIQENVPDLFEDSSSKLNEENHIHIIQLKHWLNRLLNNYQRLRQEQQLYKMEKNDFKELRDHLSTYVEMNDCLNVKLQDMQELLHEKNIEINTTKEKLQECTKKFEELQKLKVEFERLKLSEEKIYKERIETIKKHIEEKQMKIKYIEKEMHDMKEKYLKLQMKLSNHQQQHANLVQDHKKLNEKYKQQEMKLEALENELTQKKKECMQLQKQRKDLEDRVSIVTKSVEDMAANKLASEDLCEKQQMKFKQLQRDWELLNVQQQKQLHDNQHLANDIQGLKSDKALLREEIKDLKLDLQRSNDNVSQLIIQLGSIRSEKDAVLEECQTLREELAGQQQLRNECEKQLKCLEEKVSTMANELQISKMNTKELSIKNQKLNETNESNTKRIEKMALKLGETQARCSKLEKENEKMAKNFSSNASILESLQKEKELLQMEAKSLKDRLTRAERCQEQLVVKVQNLEDTNRALKEAKESLESIESISKTKLNRLEKIRDTNEDKLRKLTADLHASESLNVKLNLEIGALNSQLKQINIEQIEKLTKSLKISEDQVHNLQEQIETLKKELDKLHEEKSDINDQLSKVTINLSISKENYEKLNNEMEQLRTEMLILREEKRRAEQQLELLNNKFEECQCQNEQILQDRQNEINLLETKLSQLDNDLQDKIKEISEAKVHTKKMPVQTKIAAPTADEANEAKIEEINDKKYDEALTENTKLKNELDNLNQRVLEIEKALQEEQQKNSQLLMDNKILFNKYQHSKQRAEELFNDSEERIKENRLEWESKLEKMKEKMKKLYMEETTKIKCKHDRELAALKIEMENLKSQNEKYEEHTRKLSSQIVRLNEKLLDHQKENAMLSTQLKHLKDLEEKKRPSSSIYGMTTSANLGSNLTMEDEEGEIFNNTYLTDLKAGRMSGYMSRDVCPEELKHRNSLLPPHLKCSYAIQFSHAMPEDDIKESRHSFDNSMMALLNTTCDDNRSAGGRSGVGAGNGNGNGVGGASKKKSCGSTHYKRPGPPTPSKNRLSFGACLSNVSEPLKESLGDNYHNNKDSDDDAPIAVAKTPARFNFFASRFSMGKTTDESMKKSDKVEENLQSKMLQRKCIINKSNNNNINNSIAKYIKAKDMKKENKDAKVEGAVGGSDAIYEDNSNEVCTSTPRKSKIHFNQRRLLDQLISSTGMTSPSSPFAINSSNIKANKQILQYKTTKLSNYKNGQYKSQLNSNNSRIKRRLCRHLQKIFTPTSTETTSSATNTNTPKSHPRIPLINTSSSSDIKSNIQKCLQQFYKREREREREHERYRKQRPSICVTGNMFAKNSRKKSITTTTTTTGGGGGGGGKRTDIQRFKARKQRFEQFNKARNIDQTIIKNCEEDNAINKSSNEKLFKNYTLNKTTRMMMHKLNESSQDEEEEEEEEKEETKVSAIYKNHLRNDKFCQNMFKQFQPNKIDLITTQDFQKFDYFVEQQQKQQQQEEEQQHQKHQMINTILEECFEENRKKFEMLINQKLSTAPFLITTKNHKQFQQTAKNIHYITNKDENEIENANGQINNNSGHQNNSKNAHDGTTKGHLLVTKTALSIPQQLHHHDNKNDSTLNYQKSSLSSVSSASTRTIYGMSLIYGHHRLPHINTTYGRRTSSFYMQRKHRQKYQWHHQSNSKRQQHSRTTISKNILFDINGPLTLLDLIRMWSQMNNSTRLLISLIILASSVTFIALFIRLFSDT